MSIEVNRYAVRSAGIDIATAMTWANDGVTVVVPLAWSSDIAPTLRIYDSQRDVIAGRPVSLLSATVKGASAQPSIDGDTPIELVRRVGPWRCIVERNDGDPIVGAVWRGEQAILRAPGESPETTTWRTVKARHSDLFSWVDRPVWAPVSPAS